MSFIGGNRLRPHTEEASSLDGRFIKLDSDKNFIVKDGNVYLKVSDYTVVSPAELDESQSHN